MKRGKLLLFWRKGICVLGLFYHITGYTQEATLTSGEENPKSSVDSLILQNTPLNEVIVSAFRWEEELLDVPHKIITMDRGNIGFQNPQTSADLLGQSGEVFIQKSQMGGGSPMIRGFAANRILLAVDGVRMNNAIFRSGNLQNVISIDPMSVQNTEVIFGPGSVVYGSDAIGGVMNFYTLSPGLSDDGKPKTSTSVTIRTASANKEKTGHFDFNLGFDQWAFLTSVSYSDFGDLKMGSKGPDDYLRVAYVDRINGMDTMLTNPDPLIQVPTSYQQINLMQKVKYKAGNKLDFEYGFHYSTTSDYARYDRLTRYRGSSLRSAEWYYGPQEWMMNNLKLVHFNEGGILYDAINITLAHQFFEESRHDRDFKNETKYNRTEKVNVISGNIDFEKAAGNSTYYYGVEYLANMIGSTGTDEDINTGILIPGPGRYPDESTWNSMGIYFSNKWNISSKLVLMSGLRYNHVAIKADFEGTFYDFPFKNAEISNAALTGSAGLSFKLNNRLIVKANLSTAFRSPNIDDVGKVFDSSPPSVVVPNIDLAPEYAYNVDFTIQKSLNDHLSVEVSGFYTFLNNAMVRRDFKLNGQDSIIYDGETSKVQAIQNAAYARVYGGSMKLIFNYGPFGLNGILNVQEGEEELDDGTTAPLRHASPLFWSSHLTYQTDHFKADFYAVANGAISNADLAPEEQGKDYLYAADVNGNPYSPKWYTLNLKIQHQFKKYLTLTGGIENITDQRYRPYSSGISAPGRNFLVSMSVTL